MIENLQMLHNKFFVQPSLNELLNLEINYKIYFVGKVSLALGQIIDDYPDKRNNCFIESRKKQKRCIFYFPLYYDRIIQKERWKGGSEKKPEKLTN